MESYMFSADIKKDIKKLCIYDNYHGLCAVALDFLVVVFSIALSQYNFLFYPLVLVVIGSRQRALATILHESAHGALSKNKVLNKFVGTYCSGYLICQAWVAYKRSHVVSHYHALGDIGVDPDYKYYMESGVYEVVSPVRFFNRFFLRPVLFLNAFSSVRYLIVNRLLSRSVRDELPSILMSQLLVFFVLYYAVGTYAYIFYWLMPYFTTFQALTWFIELSEHYPMVRDAPSNLYATRNRFGGSVEHFLTSMHGENFHLIHHLFPGIPFWNLRKAHNVLLRDREYAALNSKFGGIFTSSNFTAPMWSVLLFAK